MNQFKRAQVIMLPTNNKSNILLYHNPSGSIRLKKYNSSLSSNEIRYTNHIYIISDDEIKEGNWCYHKASKEIVQYPKGGFPNGHSQKIIATTDTSLNPLCVKVKCDCIDKCKLKKLPEPSQQFIEKYIESYNKGEIITDILVNYEFDYIYPEMFNEKLRLKVNPKDNTITTKKLKDSWNREEIIDLIKLFANNYQYASNDIGYNKWIEENL